MLIFYLARIENPEDQAKMALLYETYKQDLFKRAQSLLHDENLAEDAVHETFMYLADKDKLAQIKEPLTPQTKHYLLRITLSKARDILRSRTNEEASSEIELVSSEDIAAEAESKNVLSILKTYLLTLPEKERQLLYCLYGSGKISTQELAKLDHVTQKTIYNRRDAIIKKLREMAGREDLLD